MKNIGGVFLPDHEDHMVGWMRNANVRRNGVLTYQWSKLEAAMRHVKRFGTAIDVGAHVGTWSMHLARMFERVIAFEPLPEHCDCFAQNVPGENVKLYACALGARTENVGIRVEIGSSGATHIVGSGETPVATLDSFGIEGVDFIKIDVEGYELFVVQGGEKTIRRYRPTMVVEQKPKGLAERYGQSRMAAVELLTSWGAKQKFEMSGDYCVAWD